MYVWDWTRRSGWQLKKIGAPTSANFQIWRQEKDGEPNLIEALNDYRDVISVMARLEQAEKDRGAATVKHLANPRFGTVNGFTVSTEQHVIVTNDGSGLSRYRLAHAPSVHYWVETVFRADQCEIENARYARSPRHVRENGA